MTAHSIPMDASTATLDQVTARWFEDIIGKRFIDTLDTTKELYFDWDHRAERQ